MDPKRLAWWLGLGLFLAGLSAGLYTGTTQEVSGLEGPLYLLAGPALALLYMAGAIVWSHLHAPALPRVFTATTFVLALVAGGVTASVAFEMGTHVASALSYAAFGVVSLAVLVTGAAWTMDRIAATT